MEVVSIIWPVLMLATVAGFWLTPDRFREYFLAAVTFGVIAWFDWRSVAILSIFTCAVYFVVQVKRKVTKGALALFAVIALTLVAFKLMAAETGGGVFLHTVLPLGISYYTFRCLHYLLEAYKGNIPRHGFREFAGYLFFLPTLIAGPIHRFPEFNRDTNRRRWDPGNISLGMERILYGYFKITFLGNLITLGTVTTLIGWIDPARESLIAYCKMLQLGFNIYFQFAGYSDIAIGFALLLGYNVIENFNWPFIRRNIVEFWQCWHYSLSSWCRDYIYAPVTAVTRKPALGAIASMLVLGLWHEISFRYILWGALHGCAIVVCHKFGDLKPRLPDVKSAPLRGALHVLSVLLTFHFVMLAMLIVNTENMDEAMGMFHAILLAWKW